MKEESGPAYETLPYDCYCSRTYNEGTPFEDVVHDYEEARKLRVALTDWRIALTAMETGHELENVALASVRVNYFLEALPTLWISKNWRREMRRIAIQTHRKYIYSIGK